jgi:hypothetical protein
MVEPPLEQGAPWPKALDFQAALAPRLQELSEVVVVVVLAQMERVERPRGRPEAPVIMALEAQPAMPVLNGLRRVLAVEAMEEQVRPVPQPVEFTELVVAAAAEMLVLQAEWVPRD